MCSRGARVRVWTSRTSIQDANHQKDASEKKNTAEWPQITSSPPDYGPEEVIWEGEGPNA